MKIDVDSPLINLIIYIIAILMMIGFVIGAWSLFAFVVISIWKAMT